MPKFADLDHKAKFNLYDVEFLRYKYAHCSRNLFHCKLCAHLIIRYRQFLWICEYYVNPRAKLSK